MTFFEYFQDESRTASAVIMALVFVGVALRHHRKIHPKIMLSCFGLDVLLLLYVEVSRKAVEQSVSGMTPLLALHIALAVGMMAYYIVLIRSGRKLLKPRDGMDLVKIRKRHGISALIFILLRISVMVTAVMVAKDFNAS